jgi:hypothetical protein
MKSQMNGLLLYHCSEETDNRFVVLGGISQLFQQLTVHLLDIDNVRENLGNILSRLDNFG